MSFREPINFFSIPVLHQIADHIIPQLPGQDFAAIWEIASWVPDAKLRLLVGFLYQNLPLEFQMPGTVL